MQQNIWQFKLLKVSTFIWLTFALSNCNYNSDEQLDLNGEQDFVIQFTDTITINTSVVTLKPFKTNAPESLLFGEYKDPDFGTISAKTFTQLNYGGGTVSRDAIFDSLVMHLHTEYQYGDFLKPQEIYIYELDENLLNKSYYSSAESLIKPEPLNEQTAFLSSPGDTSTINIRMKPRLGTTFFEMIRSNAADFNSQERFHSYFKGISITSGPANNAIYGIDPSLAKTRLSIYFHEKDSKMVKRIDFNCSGVVQYNYIHEALVNPLLANLKKGEEVSTGLLGKNSYINTGSYVLTKISFPYLDNFASEIGDIVINDAELILENTRAYSKSTSPPSTFFLLETDDRNQLTYYVDEDEDANEDEDDTRDSTIRAVQVNDPQFTKGYGNNLSFSFNKDLNNYSAHLTHYIEALIDKTKSNNGVLLYPAGIGSQVNTLIFGDATHPAKKMKLKLYYTILHKKKENLTDQ